jgi:hypothetical protein
MVAVLAASVVVVLTGPHDIAVARVLFARNAASFKELMLRPGDLTPRFETVNLLRAHLAADMTFLVVYGLLLLATIRVLFPRHRARLARTGPIFLMIAGAVENITALTILRTLGESTDAAPWWFVAMYLASAAKWLIAGIVLLWLAKGWWRKAGEDRGYRPLGWLIAVAFAVGGAASASVILGLFSHLPGWLPATALIASAVGLLAQFYLLGTGTLLLRFLYLSRVPLLILLVLASFGPVALGPAVDMLGGILVAGNITGVAVTTAAAMAVLFACRTQINIVRAYAWLRVQDNSLRVLHHPVLASCVYWTGVVAAGSLLFSVGLVSLSLRLWQIAAGIVIGALASEIILFAIDLIAALLSSNPPGHRPPRVSPPFRWFRSLTTVLKATRQRRTPSAKRLQLTGALVSWVFGDDSGYVEVLPGGQRRILPGHTFASVQFVLTFVLFWAALYLKSSAGVPDPYTQTPDTIEAAFLAPTVTSIVLLLLLIGWLFAGVAFFLDRYRTPVFTIVLAAAVTTGAWSRTDYLVSTTTQPSGVYPLATPGEVLKAFGDRPLVVAAAGGGIQAGAWTARVLYGLDESLGHTLRSRVALLSSVSGGSMGTLYYGAYQGERSEEDSLHHAAQQALKPSLDEVGTSLVGRDIFGVIGLRLRPDRGAALEDTWERRLPPGVSPNSRTLRGWSEAVRDFARGDRRDRPFPAFLFNSTVVETGKPIVFATTQFPTSAYRHKDADGHSEYPTVESASTILRLSDSDSWAGDIGIKAATAARLSAAFPYVSPAATLDHASVEQYHLVDGGYYDFHGLVALSQWVDDALEELSSEHKAPAMIGVLIVRGLVTSDSAQHRDGDPLDLSIDRHGWRWQLTAPPAAALHASSFGQFAGGMQTLRLLMGKWKERGVTIIPRVFDYPGNDRTPVCQGSPLSWKLTAPQQQCIETAWDSFRDDPLPWSLR